MQPNARELLINKKILGTDELVDKILNQPNSAEAELFLKAKEINKSKLKKGYIESALLASNHLDKISELLEMHVDVVYMYAHIFYNVVNLDKLSKMELLNVDDSSEASLKLWALSQGLDFLAWRLGKQVNISPVNGLQELFTTCMYKAKEAMFNSNVADASKESTKWVKLSLDIARLIKSWTMDVDEARKDIELALQEIIPDFQGLDSLQ